MEFPPPSKDISSKMKKDVEKLRELNQKLLVEIDRHSSGTITLDQLDQIAVSLFTEGFNYPPMIYINSKSLKGIHSHVYKEVSGYRHIYDTCINTHWLENHLARLRLAESVYQVSCMVNRDHPLFKQCNWEFEYTPLKLP